MDIKRIVGMVLLGLLVILGVGLGFESGEEDATDNSPYFWLGHARSGILESLSPTEAVLKADNSTFTFEVNSKTKFTSRGGPGQAGPGSHVQVRYGIVGTKNVARQIRLLKPLEGATPAAATPGETGSPATPGSGSATTPGSASTPEGGSPTPEVAPTGSGTP